MASHASSAEYLHYFAYGSNMLTRRIRAADRAPSAKPLAIASLERWRLRFNKIGRDSSGKGNIEHTGDDADRVWGVLFEIAPSDRRALDRAEGLGVGYRDAEVLVTTAFGDLPALTYIANQTDDKLLPFCWYHALVVAGAVEHALPESHVDAIRGFSAQDDPDEQRAELMWKLLL